MPTEHDITMLRDRIAHLEGQVAFLYRHLGVTFVPEASRGVEEIKGRLAI